MARTAILTLAILLVTAASASAHDGGEGWYGVTNDTVVTNAGFIVIAGIPALLLLLSLAMWRLEKRKDRRKAAAKGRAKTAQWGGGW